MPCGSPVCTAVINVPFAKANREQSKKHRVLHEKPSVLFLLSFKCLNSISDIIDARTGSKLTSSAAAIVYNSQQLPLAGLRIYCWSEQLEAVASCVCISCLFTRKESWLVMNSNEILKLNENAFHWKLAKWTVKISELKSGWSSGRAGLNKCLKKRLKVKWRVRRNYRPSHPSSSGSNIQGSSTKSHSLKREMHTSCLSSQVYI